MVLRNSIHISVQMSHLGPGLCLMIMMPRIFHSHIDGQKDQLTVGSPFSRFLYFKWI